MQGYNVIIIYNSALDKLLMCKRRKDPYKGLYNLVGGKIETGEDSLSAAYRELYEETGISDKDTKLYHIMDFTYYFQDCYVEVYVGRLNNDIAVKGDENELFWIDGADNDFFDMAVFAGEGNIGHMIEQVKAVWDIIFKE